MTVAEARSEPRGVSADDIRSAIELMLGRTPEESLVQYHLELQFRDRFELGAYIQSTEEFRARTTQKRPEPIFLGDRVMAHTHRNEIIYLVPGDLDLTPHIMLHGKWEMHVDRAIQQCVRPGDTVIDIGANIGYHTMGIAHGVGPTGKVHAFEANPVLVDLLRASFFVNGYSSFQGRGRIDLHAMAVSDKPGELILESAPGHFGSGHVITEKETSDFGAAYSVRTSVPAVRLDDVLADVPSVDFIHMDIEGAEPLAMAGARALLERSPGVRIMQEWSPGMMSTVADLPAYIDELDRQGYRFWRVEGHGLTSVAVHNLAGLDHCDLIITRQDSPTV